ncbi:MAG: SDR family oxidoreductase [Saprospiraceae bacterium]|nr:SDR family oxidoreductase [Saprospiraceae bacterium]
MRILLTGATGYIGKRLLQNLSESDHEIYCLVRDRNRLKLDSKYAFPEKIHLIEADMMVDDLENILPLDVDIVYYLVHSMSASSTDFADMETTMANQFVKYLNCTTAKQCIYLSGIVNDDNLSKHLQSRFKTEQILSSSKVPLTTLRAAIVIGSGSASFEIIRDLVEKLPIMIAPKWINTKCQPIAIRDVISYLLSTTGDPRFYDKSFDIGGPEILTYKEMMMAYAKHRGLKRWIISVPIFSPKLSSYWLYFVTSTSYKLASSLVSSMKNDVVCKNKEILDLLPHPQIDYMKALELANSMIINNFVVSSWKDAFSSGLINYNYYKRKVRVPKYGCFVDKKTKDFPLENITMVRDKIWSIGGVNGWYSSSFLWSMRGLLDKTFGGVGLRRGRRDIHDLTEGDAIDFWRVLVADKEENRLLLLAEMKLPGEAWLEFKILQDEEKATLVQKAVFRPKGLLGRLYWYAVYPFHYLIFPKIVTNLTQQTKAKT